MELRINLNPEELKAAMDSGSLAKLIADCTFGGDGETDTAALTPVAPVAPAPAAPVTPAPATPAPVASAPTATATMDTPAQATVPTTPTKYTVDDLAQAAVSLMDMGKQAEIRPLIESFGVQAIPQLQEVQYDAFALKLREMGAQI